MVNLAYSEIAMSLYRGSKLRDPTYMASRAPLPPSQKLNIRHFLGVFKVRVLYSYLSWTPD